MDDDRTLVNLASKEYLKCIEEYHAPDDRYITCVFGEPENRKILHECSTEQTQGASNL